MKAYYCQRENFCSGFSENSKTNASEFQESIEEVFHLYIHTDVCSGTKRMVLPSENLVEFCVLFLVENCYISYFSTQTLCTCGLFVEEGPLKYLGHLLV